MDNKPIFIFDAATRDETIQIIDLALAEDLGSAESAHQLDLTTESVVPEHLIGSASFVARQPGIVCGLVVIELVIDRVNRDLTLHVQRKDGDPVQPGDKLADLSGNAQDILIAERTCLNFLGRLSGISSMTHQFVQQAAGTKAQILDTRKTTPGWRRLEKYAVICGGGTNHRMGLYDAVLIKDNHLAMMDLLTDEPLDEIRQAIHSARAWIKKNSRRLPNGENTIVEIEVDRLEQFEKAIQTSVDIILLDNMTNREMEMAVEIRDQRSPETLLEASGGVNLKTIGNIARTGVDRISAGALTHSSVNLDIGLDWTFD